MDAVAKCIITSDRDEIIDAQPFKIFHYLISEVIHIGIVSIAQVIRDIASFNRTRSRTGTMEKCTAGTPCFVDDSLCEFKEMFTIVSRRIAEHATSPAHPLRIPITWYPS
jgi:hypothetical protein